MPELLEAEPDALSEFRQSALFDFYENSCSTNIRPLRGGASPRHGFLSAFHRDPGATLRFGLVLYEKTFQGHQRACQKDASLQLRINGWSDGVISGWLRSLLFF